MRVREDKNPVSKTTENLAKLMATENINVEFKKVSTPSFELVSRTLTLPLWKDISKKPQKKYNKFSKTGTLKGLKNEKHECEEINALLQLVNSLNLGACKHKLMKQILSQMNSNTNCYYKHTKGLSKIFKPSVSRYQKI